MKSLEALLDPDRRNGFLERQAAVLETASSLDLRPGNAVLFGGAAMALHGLDTYVGPDILHGSFDLEAYIVKNKLTAFQGRPLAVTMDGRNSRVQIDTAAGIPLAFTGFTGFVFDSLYGYESHEAASADSVDVAGLATLSVDTLAAMKLAAGRPKDKAGLIQAHIIGEHMASPITQKSSWRTLVATAIAEVRQDYLPPGAGVAHEQYPEWVAVLAHNGFAHPAFATEAFEQASR